MSAGNDASNVVGSADIGVICRNTSVSVAGELEQAARKILRKSKAIVINQ
jgi:hypothetical protein